MKAYKIKIELIGSNPLIWRRVSIPAGATFYRLYETIQNSMGWGNFINDTHLYEFDLRAENLSITNNLEAFNESKSYKAQFKNVTLDKKNDPFGIIAKNLEKIVRQPKTIKIDAYIEKYKTLNYTYDFGEGFQHLITLEDILEDYHYGYPMLIEGEGDCPPKDVGRKFDKDFINSRLKFIKFKNTERDERLVAEQKLLDRILMVKTDTLEKGFTKTIINKNINIMIEQGEKETMARKIVMMYIHKQRKALIKKTKLT